MADSPLGRRAWIVGALLGGVVTVAGVEPAQAVINTQKDASGLSFVACNARVGFRSFEPQQGHTDLTSDGDANDYAFQVVDLASSAVTNVHIDAGGPLACGGDKFAFGVSEASQGNTDRNGDGDTFDTVLAVYDAGTATLTNMGRAVSAIVASPQLIAFTVYEASQGGGDLNGDGDVLDKVLHVLDPTTMVVTNLGREAGDSVHIKVVGKRVAFFLSETAQGNTDFNGDGDPLDTVVLIYDAATSTLINPNRAVAPDLGIQLDGAVAAFVVSEPGQGPSSLNGDLDSNDSVLSLYCFGSPPCVSSGLINVGVDASGGFTLGGDLLAFRARERNQGLPGGTLNLPDSDARDFVVHYYRISTGVTTNTQLAGQAKIRIVGNRLGFGVPERLQNHTDRDSDTDARDVVLTVYDTLTSTVTNTGRALWSRTCRKEATLATPKGPCTAAGADMIAFANGEKEQGKTDQNGDGDYRDAVIQIWRLSTNTLVSTQLAGEHKSTIVTSGDLAAFRVSEKDQGVDLNGDSDSGDFVLAVYNAATNTITQLGQQSEAPILIEGNYVVFRTSEAGQNTDLDGDGDTGDFVLQYQAF